MKKYNKIGHPMNQMAKGMAGMAMGGMVAGAGLSAMSKAGMPASVGSGLSTGAEMMPAVGAMVGAGAVMGMASQLMPKTPKMKHKRR